MNTSFWKAVKVTLVAATLAVAGCRDFFKTCDDCGVIQSINSRAVQGEPRPAGTIAGAIIGGVVGHQVGSGRGNDVATAAGAVGGAMIGNKIERDRARYMVYDVTVQMDKGGGVRHLTLGALGDLRIGDKVEVRGDQLVPLAANQG